jgi:hypothetical protein
MISSTTPFPTACMIEAEQPPPHLRTLIGPFTPTVEMHRIKDPFHDVEDRCAAPHLNRERAHCSIGLELALETGGAYRREWCRGRECGGLLWSVRCS